MAINEAFNYENDPFAVKAVFNINGTARSVWGHFTEATESVSIYTGQIEANDASFSTNTADVADVKNGMAVEINGSTLTVKRKQRIGTGDSILYLKT